MQMYDVKMEFPKYNTLIFNYLVGSVPYSIPSHLNVLKFITLFGFHIYKQNTPFPTRKVNLSCSIINHVCIS